jgi:hypothetical protein
LTGCAINFVALSVVMLSDPVSHRVCAACAGLGELAKLWHTSSNQEGRSSEGSFEWLKGQVDGGFVQHCSGIVSRCVDLRFVVDIGFEVNKGRIQTLCDDDIGMEDELANMILDMQLCLVKHRLCRGLRVTLGWPWRMVGIHCGAAVAASTLSLFKDDIKIHKALREFAPATAEVVRIKNRHLFIKTSNQQLRLACEDPSVHFSPHPDLQHMVREWSAVRCQWGPEEQKTSHVRCSLQKTREKYVCRIVSKCV